MIATVLEETWGLAVVGEAAPAFQAGPKRASRGGDGRGGGGRGGGGGRAVILRPLPEG